MASKKIPNATVVTFHSAFFPKAPTVEKLDVRRLAMNGDYIRPQTLSSSIEKILAHNGISAEGFDALTGCEFDFDDERSIIECNFTDEEFFDDGEGTTNYIESEPEMGRASEKGLPLDDNVLGQTEKHGGASASEVSIGGAKDDGAASKAPSES